MNFQIKTNRLLLSVLDASAAPLTLDFYQKYASDFQPFESPYGDSFFTLNYQQELLAAEQKLILRKTLIRYWAFLLDRPDEIIGTVSFRNIQPAPVLDCEIGYKIAPPFQKNGYAREMLSATLSLLFKEYHMHRIHGLVEEENLSSIQLLNYFHFQKEGTCRKSFRSIDGWKDVDLYALLDEDFFSTHEPQ